MSYWIPKELFGSVHEGSRWIVAVDFFLSTHYNIILNFALQEEVIGMRVSQVAISLVVSYRSMIFSESTSQHTAVEKCQSRLRIFLKHEPLVKSLTKQCRFRIDEFF